MSFDVTRRQLLATGAAAATLPLLGDRASAQGAWPNKPIKVVVGYPAGGQTDNQNQEEYAHQKLLHLSIWQNPFLRTGNK